MSPEEVEDPSPNSCRFWRTNVSSMPTAGALVLRREDDRVVARVLGMALHNGRYEPHVYAALDITAAVNSRLRHALRTLRGRWMSVRQPDLDDPTIGDAFDELPAVATAPPLSWHMFTSNIWLSSATPWSKDDPHPLYMIVRDSGHDQAEPFCLRVIHPVALHARGPWAGSGTLLIRCATLVEAQQHAEHHATRQSHAGSPDVPASFPAISLQRFCWHVPNATDEFTLTVALEGRRVVTRVIAMCHTDGVDKPVTIATLETGNMWAARGLPECGDCFARACTPHSEACTHARCPDCGSPRLDCTRHVPDRPALWHGFDPALHVARKRGWLHSPGHPDHPDHVAVPMEDLGRVHVAEHHGLITWDPSRQLYRTAQPINDNELDRLVLAARDSAPGRATEGTP